MFSRGPKGVWTLEKKGLKPDINVSWDDAKPTYTHMALARYRQYYWVIFTLILFNVNYINFRLVNMGKVKFVITQNIDGLHLRYLILIIVSILFHLFISPF